MSGVAARWVCGLTVLAMAPTLFLASLNEPSSLRNTAFVSIVILAFSTVGALVASRRPENSIGWFFVCGAFAWILGELALEYAVYSLITSPGTFPAGDLAAWFGAWVRGVGWFLIVMFLLLLFPNGRLPSSRWRPVLWGALCYIAFFTVTIWLSPKSFDLRLAAYESNPLGLQLEGVVLLFDIVYVTFPLLVVASGAAVIARFLHSRGDERQQIKWFAYAVAVMVLVFVIWFSFALMGVAQASALMFTIPLVGLPVAVGVAILRYRLYDIDIVINRTLVYGSLTATLAAVYVVCVVVLQYLFHALTGRESQLAVVASTLLIAALFNPLRRRIQASIDRCFYRRKYDAARTLDEFGSRLREETDLDSLNAHLVEVVRETLQPAHVSLWMRTPEHEAGKEARA